MHKIKVLIVDDSALIRKMLTEILGGDPDIEVVGAAADPYAARDKIKKLNPDVLTLDVEMPRMDGITFLGNLMRLRPMPVVMISSLTEQGAEITLRALELGAVDFVAKPKLDVAQGMQDYAEDIRAKVRMAAQVPASALECRVRAPVAPVAPKLSADAVLGAAPGAAHPPLPLKTTEKLVAIGASTGGTEAIKAVLCLLPADAPGIVITQHIPAAFSGPFAARMDSLCALSVCEASDGQQILPGHVYIAPGGRHLLVARSGARYVCKLSDGPPVNRHRPSVDVLFRSVAQSAGANAVGVILTGMGDDGAAGLLEMLQAGASTFAQDEASSVVWGMPGRAWQLGAAQHLLPLREIAAGILARVAERR
ncbi:MAG: chemotaxis response regulator protein-glutamate methylesterase [Gammaproteobacteria bacterium]|nr:chemotaxis response regulator protein-glutamate methylesterase [Gammaproteobacteria bacterium]